MSPAQIATLRRSEPIRFNVPGPRPDDDGASRFWPRRQVVLRFGDWNRWHAADAETAHREHGREARLAFHFSIPIRKSLREWHPFNPVPILASRLSRVNHQSRVSFMARNA